MPKQPTIDTDIDHPIAEQPDETDPEYQRQLDEFMRQTEEAGRRTEEETFARHEHPPE